LSTFTIAVTAAISLVCTAVLGFVLIPFLRRLKFGQTILEIGPKWHKEKKQGIPTMGGLMFIAGVLLSFTCGMILLWNDGGIDLAGVGRFPFISALSGLVMAVFFAFVGFLDDYIKVRKKRNEGLTANQKIVLQLFIISAYFATRIISGNTSTILKFPFLFDLDLWYFYYILMGLGILYLVNAVNLTDGLDGLCSSVSFIYYIAFLIICSLLQFNELGILAVAAAGGCIGFLIWNFYPAKVFMGDTGSMFLGGLVCALGIGSGAEVLMVIAGAVYIWEALSVLIQMTYFKITGGKRLFKMTPIHHSFEIRGWKEVKIVGVFTLISILAGGLAIALSFGF
jgi:phospho-N-acetylmuramoyl-pentapeptide-transferase